jgi:transcriptional regulator of arginine metabolism
MRYSRQNKILELIATTDVDTQEKLADMLADAGYEVTQATVSRDIKELQLVKTLTPAGGYKYTAPGQEARPVSDRFVKIFRETIQSIACSGNIIVAKTLPGCANAAAEAMDNMGSGHILGTIAGDNTIMIVADDPENAPAMVERFKSMLK